MRAPLHIHSFPGAHTGSLGHYLMGLGLLRALAQPWPEARAWWDGGGVLQVALPVADINAVYDWLLQEWKPTPYEKWWSEAQSKDTKAKSSAMVIDAATRQGLAQVRLARSTIVSLARNQFNPVFGTGGNIGKRDLGKGWEEASKTIESNRAKKLKEVRAWLVAALQGDEAVEVPSFTVGGTWFVYNNKLFNSGLEWARGGDLSPWSYLLALEGALLLTGGAGRRLGARSTPYAVFPFVSAPLQPTNDGEVGMARAEFWAPVWDHPATLPEVSLLLLRGLAKIGGRQAIAPHEFAVAARAAGAEAGVREFARFELRQTTSSQVYEAIPRPLISIEQSESQASQLLQPLLGPAWFDRLPRDQTSSSAGGKFFGYRGPIERAIIAVAEKPEDALVWRDLLAVLAQTQSRLDRNQDDRKKARALPLLARDWLKKAWPGKTTIGVTAAKALASLGAGTNYPALCNVYGVECQGSWTSFPEARPASAVGHDGDPLSALLAIVERRLVDSEKPDGDGKPVKSVADRGILAATHPLTAEEIQEFLVADSKTLRQTRDELVRLSLVNWREYRREDLPRGESAKPQSQPELLLWTYFKPFFVTDPSFWRLVATNASKGDADLAAYLPRVSLTRRIFYLLRANNLGSAIDLAAGGYAARRLSIIPPPVVKDNSAAAIAAAGKLACALALPIRNKELHELLKRRTTPQKT